MAGRILIADDVTTNRIILKVKLSSACYDVLQAESGADALALARREKPDLILLDLMMSGMNGIEVCRRLKACSATDDIPVIIITAVHDEQLKLRALRAGADDFLTKPVSEALLLARVRNLLRTRDTNDELRLHDGTEPRMTEQELGFAEPMAGFARPCNIVLVARSEEIARQWQQGLKGRIAGEIRIVPRSAALTVTDSDPAPDIFVLEGGTGTADDGIYLISELRSRAHTRHAAIIVILPAPDPGRESHEPWAATALDLGACDILSNGFGAEELALRLERQIARKHRADQLRETLRNGLRLAVTDPLTGLHNRRYAMARLARIARQAHDTDSPFALMLLDLDRFKMVNDIHGHSAGDAVLREVACRLRQGIRRVDLLARIGGEEFLVVMPDTDLGTARKTAERLRRRIVEQPVRIPADGQELFVSLSIGVALGGGREHDLSVTEVMEQADRALYAAKSDGRNQVNIGRSAA